MGFALLLGVLFDRLIVAPSTNGALALHWAAFWLVCGVLLCGLFWRNALRRWQAWVVMGITVLLCVSNAMRSREAISLINLPVIPLLLMLYTQLVVAEDSAEADPIVALRVVRGFCMWPFMRLGDAGCALASVLGKAGKGRGRGILMGLAIAAPLLIVVCALLLQADAVALHFAHSLLTGLPIGQILLHVLCVVVVAALFTSFLINAKQCDVQQNVALPEQNLAPSMISIVLASLIAVYALFCGVQFAYLFGSRGLPADLTYSEYARQGFGQLLAVAAINLGVFALTLRFARPHAVVRGLLFALLACTGVLLASGLLRLKLYIGAYGLTWLRVFPYTFMVAMCVVLVLCAVRLLLLKLPLLRAVALVCLLWYTGLALVNIEAVMVRWNVHNAPHTMTAWVRNDWPGDDQLDERKPYVFTLSSDAVPELLAYCQTLPQSAPEWMWLREHLDDLCANGAWSLADRHAQALLSEAFDVEL